jgi:glycosyltransferase involved in cell wall biosynthesis
VPVVGSNSGAIPEVVGDGGLVYPEGDVGRLANCLQQLRDSPELCRSLALAGRRRVEGHYTQERIAARTAALFRDLMRADHQATPEAAHAGH